MQYLLDFIVRNIMAFWPIARVYTWQQGLRVRNGQVKEILYPGLHWRWWFIDEIFKQTSTEQTLDLPACSITTTDGVPIVLSANIAWRVVDVKTQWSTVWSIDVSLAKLMHGLVAQFCSGKSIAELSTNRAALQVYLAQQLTEQGQQWGTEVTRVHVTDFVRARQIKLFGDGFKQ